ncbi:ABC transporter ATP-binding protein [Candidatus Woesebacteria bacterium]|nr:ABC transporter ATP-binding protein [Candidatus Woesebacteria bacterium]
MNTSGVHIDNVSFQYGVGGYELDGVTTTIASGSFCGITGVNGSGKTTCTYLLNGLIPHQIEGKLTGDVLVDGISTRSKPVSYFAQKVGMVFQNPDFMIFNLTVKEEIAFGLTNLGLDRVDERVEKSLTEVGLAGYEDRDPHMLSLGQKQKLAIATVLAMDTSYIVLDEPSAMLDYHSAIELYSLLTKLNKQGKTIIVVEHDTDFLLTYADSMIVLDNGSCVLQGSTEKVFEEKRQLQELGIKIPRRVSYE